MIHCRKWRFRYRLFHLQSSTGPVADRASQVRGCYSHKKRNTVRLRLIYTATAEQERHAALGDGDFSEDGESISPCVTRSSYP